MSLKRWLILFIVLFLVPGLFCNAYAQQKRKPVLVSGKTFLPLRVLARPFSNIYKQADEKSGIEQENVPVFQSYYVYTQPKVTVSGTKTEGWYEVGSDNRGTVLGWMKAEDVMEWKQTMCLAYEHPGGRKPVLMFEGLKALQEIVKAPSDDRVKKAEAYYRQIESKDIPKDFPIISMEPKDAIDITEQFYLLPILEHADIEIEGREGRMLKLASAPKSVRGGGTLKNPEAGSKNTAAAPVNPEAAMLKNLEMDLVYVVDMTGSMGPYIDITLQAIKDMSLFITKDAEIAKSVRFGLWGYRDSPDVPGLEFNTRNFTPQLQKVGDFEKTLASVGVAKVGSKDYPEDVFSGIDKSMRETKWTDNALHIMVLLGDAPSHQPGHNWNYSGQSADTLRTFADDNKFSIFALHIKDRGATQFWQLTEEQFRTLSTNRGLEGEASYWGVDSQDMEGFEKASKAIAGGLVDMVKSAKQGKISVASVRKATTGSSNAGPKTQNNVNAKVMQLGYAALVDWIGREAGVKAPRDIIAWVTDKDLIDPAIPSLDVRVLINKKQIDSLRTVLQEIMTAGRRGIIGGEKFFDALQAVPSVASRSGDQIRNAKSLADTDLVPEFMQGLPYKSKIMNMSNDLWSSWSLDQQEEFLNEVDAKIKLYVAIHDEPKGWVPLTKGDDPDEHVYPLSLEALP